VLAVSLSDIAVMGGTPTHALVALVLPPDLELRWIEEVYADLGDEGDRFGVAVVARRPGGR
jgi:thiamine-monophosphate kinase